MDTILNFQITIVQVLSAIIIAAASSWITVQLSLRRFRTETWWERRVAAYERIIEALHHSKAFSETNLDFHYRGRKLADEYEKQLLENAWKANQEINKAIDIGSFLLGHTACKRLEKYKKEKAYASEPENWVEHLERSKMAASACLQDIIPIARDELGTVPNH